MKAGVQRNFADLFQSLPQFFLFLSSVLRKREAVGNSLFTSYLSYPLTVGMMTMRRLLRNEQKYCPRGLAFKMPTIIGIPLENKTNPPTLSRGEVFL